MTSWLRPQREQQPFVYGSLSKEEIYLKAPAASASPIPNVSTPPALNQTTAAPAEDEQFWQAIKTSTVAGLYEEFLSRYPKSNHVVEARERIKDLRSKQVAAVSPTAAVSPSDNDTNMAREDPSQVPKSPDRSLFTSEDSQRIAVVGAKLNLKMPPFSIAATQGDLSNSHSRFVGVWSSERGWEMEKAATAC
jgi:hypothetical protein